MDVMPPSSDTEHISPTTPDYVDPFQRLELPLEPVQGGVRLPLCWVYFIIFLALPVRAELMEQSTFLAVGLARYAGRARCSRSLSLPPLPSELRAACNMSTKALAKGSPAPGPVPEGMIRLYSMKYCPFAQRTRLVLEAKGIKYETININLFSKPDWFFEKNPLGQVPVLETCTNQLIYESPVTCVFLDECYPERQLLPADPYRRAKQSMLLEHFRTFPGCIYKIVVAKGKSEDTSTLEEELQAHLNRLEQRLAESKTLFFGGDKVTMVDYMLWPWFERLEAFSLSEFLDRTPALRSWTQTMMKDPAVRATATDTAAYRSFFKLYSQQSLEACDYTP